MRIVLVGPPGSGKGTQGLRVAAAHGVPHVSSGAALRRHASPEVLARMTAGELLDDAEITPRVWQRLLEPDAAPGFVLDGFPRDVAQADALEAWLAERGERHDAVVLLDGDRDELAQRLLQRARRADRPDHNPATIARRPDV